MKQKITIFWFRRDLRLSDNVGLAKALNSAYPVLPIFIFDNTILWKLENKKDRRIDYFHQALQQMNLELKSKDARLNTFTGVPLEIFKSLSEAYDIQAVYCNRDYEPDAIKRDTEIYNYFKAKNIPFKACKDQVIFDKNEVVKNDETPYTVYTPYSKKMARKVTKERL